MTHSERYNTLLSWFPGPVVDRILEIEEELYEEEFAELKKARAEQFGWWLRMEQDVHQMMCRLPLRHKKPRSGILPLMGHAIPPRELSLKETPPQKPAAKRPSRKATLADFGLKKEPRRRWPKKRK